MRDLLFSRRSVPCCQARTSADDGRLLVIVPEDPPVIRVLTDESAEGAFAGELSRFAVTGLDLIAASG